MAFLSTDVFVTSGKAASANESPAAGSGQRSTLHAAEGHAAAQGGAPEGPSRAGPFLSGPEVYDPHGLPLRVGLTFLLLFSEKLAAEVWITLGPRV